MLYPIGIQDFGSIRRDGYLYVDKTDLVYDLATKGKYYFLSRPRRFGKSLLVSTLAAYFSGKKELFEGLAVAGLEKDWLEYPVMSIDFSGKNYCEASVLDNVLDNCLHQWEDKYGVQSRSSIPGIRFEAVIQAAYAKTGRPVVVLIDEYDKPIVDNLTDTDLSDTFRAQLQGFYSVLKAQDRYIKFGFLTGVSKLGKMSVFSGLNNLADISMDPHFANICGISEMELRRYFHSGVKELAEANNIDEEACYAKLARMYDGYHFCEESQGVYNPFSLLNTLKSTRFREYWYETGTPTFLIRFLSAGNYKLDEMPGMQVSPAVLSGINASKPHPISMLYQTGYLTITGYDPDRNRYKLDYPNEEVENGFLESLCEYYAPVVHSDSGLFIDKFIADIQNGDVNMLMRRFTAFFADMDYQIQGNAELYFQNTMYVMLKLMGQQVQVERHTSNGRIDVLIETDKYVYIMELKRDKDPQDALDQIEQKGYDWPFKASGRKVFKIGATFSTITRRLQDWTISACE